MAFVACISSIAMNSGSVHAWTKSPDHHSIEIKCACQASLSDGQSPPDMTSAVFNGQLTLIHNWPAIRCYIITPGNTDISGSNRLWKDENGPYPSHHWLGTAGVCISIKNLKNIYKKNKNKRIQIKVRRRSVIDINVPSKRTIPPAQGWCWNWGTNVNNVWNMWII